LLHGLAGIGEDQLSIAAGNRALVVAVTGFEDAQQFYRALLRIREGGERAELWRIPEGLRLGRAVVQMVRAANSPAPVAAAAGIDRLNPFDHEGDQSLATSEAIDARDVEVLLRLERPELVQSLRIGFEGPAVAAIVE